MVDLAEGVEARNRRIRRRTDRKSLVEMLATTLSLLMIAGALLFCLWVRSEVVNVGYALHQLEEQEEALIATQHNLETEEETLKQPSRIDLIAIEELGMSRVRVNQILPPAILPSQLPSSEALAMAAIGAQSGRSRQSDAGK